MRPRAPFPVPLYPLARRQAGVLSRSQLVASGLGDSQVARLVREGLLTRLDRGVFLVGPGPASWGGWAWSAVLLGGRGARLRGRSALASIGLVDAGLPIQVAVPLERALVDRDWVRFRREQPGIRRPGTTGQPPRALTEDAVLDFAADAGEAELVQVITMGCLHHTSPAMLRRALALRTRVTHRRLFEDLLAEVTDGVRSPLERRWLLDVERPHGLPRPDRNGRLVTGRRPDLRYEAQRVLIELDGLAYHQQPFRDWRRDNGHSELGWLTLRYGWSDVTTDRCGVAGNVARVLRNRGWKGTAQPCPRCQ